MKHVRFVLQCEGNFPIESSSIGNTNSLQRDIFFLLFTTLETIIDKYNFLNETEE